MYNTSISDSPHNIGRITYNSQIAFFQRKTGSPTYLSLPPLSQAVAGVRSPFTMCSAFWPGSGSFMPRSGLCGHKRTYRPHAHIISVLPRMISASSLPDFSPFKIRNLPNRPGLRLSAQTQARSSEASMNWRPLNALIAQRIATSMTSSQHLTLLHSKLHE